MRGAALLGGIGGICCGCGCIWASLWVLWTPLCSGEASTCLYSDPMEALKCKRFGVYCEVKSRAAMRC
jgi:hypothetical protein